MTKTRPEPSDRNPLDLIETDIVPAPVVKAGGTRGLMRGDLLRDFQTAAIPQVCGNPGRPESMVSDLRMDAGSHGAPPDHPVGVRLAHRQACERVGFPGRCAEQRPFWIHFQIGTLDVGFQIFVELVVRRYVVALATLFVQSDPAAPTLNK